MKYHNVLFFSLIILLSISSSGFGDENPGAPGAATAVPGMQQPSEAELINAVPEAQQTSAADATTDKPKFKKPSEAEAIDAAITYLNRDGRMIIQKSEFMAWGTYSEKLLYWPVKLRLTYKTTGSDSLRQNEYAVKISKDINGKLTAGTYYAWRTDFK